MNSMNGKTLSEQTRSHDSLEQTKIKCDICGEVFECGYAANEHRRVCPVPIDWKKAVFNKAVDTSDGSKIDE